MGAATAAAVAAGLLAVSAPANAGAGDESHDFRFPGADTLALHNGSNRYITYGASAHGYKVPYSISGKGKVVRTSKKIDGSVKFKGGYGNWVKKGSGIWTPGAFYHRKGGVGRYYLFYTAVVRHTEKKHCIGVAYSRKPTSGFHAQDKPLACPPKAQRWAIDADVTTGPQGAVWMTWRDGQRARSGGTSALSAMMLRFHAKGRVTRESKPKVLLTNNGTLAWTHYRDSGVAVLENPSAIHLKGSWYLFYSGNSWKTNYYSTGVAFCGAKLTNNKCTPMPGPKRAYFSYAGPKAHLPKRMRVHKLPGDKRGPGAMDVYRARGGKPWVTWNYLTGSSGTGRKSRVGRLHITGSGKSATFSVTLPPAK